MMTEIEMYKKNNISTPGFEKLTTAMTGGHKKAQLFQLHFFRIVDIYINFKSHYFIE